MTPYQPIDADASAAVARLRCETHGALATMLDGAPFVSRAACLWIEGVGLTMLLSDLSEHARALAQAPCCSILLGQAGPKGDPLTHPRLTLAGEARPIDKARRQAAWRESRPKATLYYDFTDFRLWQLDPSHGLLNGGFGKAYRLAPQDIAG